MSCPALRGLDDAVHCGGVYRSNVILRRASRDTGRSALRLRRLEQSLRNIFDQYSQPENQLTHALVCTLDQDRALLRPFLNWLGAKQIPPVKSLHITEQQVPGIATPGDDGVGDGLPDVVIYTDDGWAVAIESKVQLPISVGQLRRHQRTAERYGYPGTQVFAIAPTDPKQALRALLDDDQWSSGSKSQAPEPYKRWLETGVYQPLCAEPTRNIRSIQEQTARAGAESAIVKEIYAWFSDAPHAFERFAAFLYALHDQRVRIEGVTRKSVDGGRDAVGAYRLGVPSDPVLVEFALEAKCYRPPIRGRSPNTVGVKEVSRLISRIRHRQFGILVTTSVVARQAYQEVRDDGHPIVFLAGRDIAEILIGHGFQSVQQVKDLLRAKFQV